MGSSKERGRAGVLGLSSPRGSPRARSRASRDSQLPLPQWEDGAWENGDGTDEWPSPGTWEASAPRYLEHIPCPQSTIHMPPTHFQPKSQSDIFLLGPSFLARCEWAVQLQSPGSFFPVPPGALQDCTQPRVTPVPGHQSRGEDTRIREGSHALPRSGSWRLLFQNKGVTSSWGGREKSPVSLSRQDAHNSPAHALRPAVRPRAPCHLWAKALMLQDW